MIEIDLPLPKLQAFCVPYMRVVMEVFRDENYEIRNIITKTPK